jgi:hypothetical protein
MNEREVIQQLQDALRQCRDALLLCAKHLRAAPSTSMAYVFAPLDALEEAIAAADAVLAQPVACIGNDPFCPCQDGALCHYKDSPDGKTKAMPIPRQQEPVAWQFSRRYGSGLSFTKPTHDDDDDEFMPPVPLYTHPAPTVTLPPLPPTPITSWPRTDAEARVLRQWRDQIIAALRAAGVEVA